MVTLNERTHLAGILVGDRKSEWLGLRLMRRANRFLISSDV